jgi:hypothetical protein
MLDEAGLQDRRHVLSVVEGAYLADVYAAMDVFAFSSRSNLPASVPASRSIQSPCQQENVS